MYNLYDLDHPKVDKNGVKLNFKEILTGAPIGKGRRMAWTPSFNTPGPKQQNIYYLQ